MGSAALVWWVLNLQTPRAAPDEPLVNGSPLTYHTLRLRHAEEREDQMDIIIQNRALFLPVLIEQMGANEPGIKRLIRRTVAKLPDSMRDTIQIEQNPETLRAGASWGLLYLLRGYDGFKRSASDEESKLLVPALRNALTDESMFVRLNAAASIGVLNRDARETKELVATALHDKNRGVRYNAVYSLWNMFLDEKKVIAFVDGTLDPAETSIRQEAAKNLKVIISRALGTYDDPNDFE